MTARTTASNFEKIEPCSTTVITDTVKTPASFLLVHMIGNTLKGNITISASGKDPNQTLVKKKIVLVGVSGTLGHYTSVLQKYGIQLSNPRIKDHFTFIDAMELIHQDFSTQDCRRDDVTVLSSIFGQIVTAVSSQSNVEQDEVFVIIDDLTALLWTLSPSSTIASKFLQFYKGLISFLVQMHHGSLLCLWHADNSSINQNASTSDTPTFSVDPMSRSSGDPLDTYVFRHLVHLSDLWIQVRSLQSQLKGELVLHRCASSLNAFRNLHSTTRSNSTLFELRDSGPSFSPKGMAHWSL